MPLFDVWCRRIVLRTKVLVGSVSLRPVKTCSAFGPVWTGLFDNRVAKVWGRMGVFPDEARPSAMHGCNHALERNFCFLCSRRSSLHSSGLRNLRGTRKTHRKSLHLATACPPSVLGNPILPSDRFSSFFFVVCRTLLLPYSRHGNVHASFHIHAVRQVSHSCCMCQHYVVGVLFTTEPDQMSLGRF